WVRPALTGTTWLAVTLPPWLAGAISVSRTCAAAPGADSTTEVDRPEPPVFPATTACSVIGAVAAVAVGAVAAAPVAASAALPGTTTPATTGTFEVISSAALVPPSGDRAT